MASFLQKLSAELVDIIVSHLDCADIGALRLASRATNTYILRTHYPEFFKTKTRLWLDTPSLNAFVQITSTSDLVCCLENLTLTGAAKEYPTEADETELHSALLGQAFTHLKRRSKTGALCSLVLTVALQPDEEGTPQSGSDTSEYYEDEGVLWGIKNWAYIWHLAQSTFGAAMHALGHSGLSVLQELDLFSGVMGCSLYFHEFLRLPVRFPLAMVSPLVNLKALKVSLSPSLRIPPGLTQNESLQQPRIYLLDDENLPIVPSDNVLQDLSCVLSLMTPALESLHVHWYKLRSQHLPHPCLQAPDEALAPFHRPLQNCTLQGIPCNSAQLHAFLKRTRPAALHLENMQLGDDSWGAVLRHICNSSNGIESYVLDDLFDGNHALHHFEGPGKPKYPYVDRGGGPNTLVRAADEARKPVVFYIWTARALGSTFRSRWLRRRRQKYGPPKPAHEFQWLNRLPEPEGDDDSEPEPN